ncbi:MAG: hypothetical protein JO237_00335 [Pseudolabrys sp.]|nr:hypothetical protein [Pseudolabrys sp.]
MATASPASEPSTVNVVLHALGANLRLDFPFLEPTAAAAFRRGDVLWVVFDTAAKLDISALTAEGDKIIKGAGVVRTDDGATAIRIKLERPRLISFAPEGPGWAATIGDSVTDPSQPLQVARSIVGKNRSNIVIPFQAARTLHRISDPDIGDMLLVVTAFPPSRGFLKPQDFVELKALASAQGVVVQPLADDINAEIATDKIVINRPGGLMLSTSGLNERDTGGVASPVMFDAQTWGFDREAKFNVRQSELIWKAAAAPESKRRAARLNLARFYMARDMMPEAKAVLDVAIADEHGSEDASGAVLHAAANIMMGRTEDGLKELALPQVGKSNDASLWRAIALARQGSWPEAREAFKNTEASLSTLPLELQRTCMLEAARASIEVRDFNGAAKLLNDLDTLDVPHEMQPSVALLNGRLNEALGRRDDARAAYRLAADSRDRKAAAQGRLRELVLRYSLGDIKRPGMIDELETLTTTWRGDETESEGLKWLAHLYTEEGRYRDAFHTMRTALLAHPTSDLTRKIQDEAAISFDSLFLAGKGDAMPAIEALGLFYDYRELTPIGRRGDEMIRKLADRLVSVDLLEQAADLLQHQVDNRLQGAARTQVATRLAMIYLMNRKPDRALAALRNSRISDLPVDLREQRLLLEARALSDVGRHDLAIEIVSSMDGPQAKRLRADVLWAAKRWREASEQLEANYGERWKESAPLNDDERSDVLRMAIGYALGDDTMGTQSLREKYAAKMVDGPDRHAFEVVTAPIGTDSAEFRKVVSAAAGINTLDAFLRDLRARYPEKPADAEEQKPEATNRAPALPPKVPPGTRVKADPGTTGSIPQPRSRPPAAR